MSRWPPDSAARLKSCALRLFAERGFAAVTAAEIAAASGMTERTFFRHFRAKEDVLFEDYLGIAEALTACVETAPPATEAAEIMQRVADFLGERFEAAREELRVYAAVVAAEPTLRARALLRDDDWSRAIAEGLRRRGFASTPAALISATISATFRIVFDEWVSDNSRARLKIRFAAALKQLSKELG